MTDVEKMTETNRDEDDDVNGLPATSETLRNLFSSSLCES